MEIEIPYQIRLFKDRETLLIFTFSDLTSGNYVCKKYKDNVLLDYWNNNIYNTDVFPEIRDYCDNILKLVASKNLAKLVFNG